MIYSKRCGREFAFGRVGDSDEKGKQRKTENAVWTLEDICGVE
jgi:hypothetical protein